MIIGKNVCSLSAASLKLIAMFAMLLDHAALVFLEGIPYALLRAAGRMAFPLFAFLAAEGEAHTRSRPRYAARIGLAALLSEAPFRLLIEGRAIGLTGHNVLFTLLFGIMLLWLYRTAAQKRQTSIWVLFGAAMAAGLLAAWYFRFDYGGAGVLTVFLFGAWRGKRKQNALYDAFALYPLAVAGLRSIGYTAPAVYCALLPLRLYNGRCGRRMPFRMDYLFYPLHLTVLCLIAGRLG